MLSVIAVVCLMKLQNHDRRTKDKCGIFCSIEQLKCPGNMCILIGYPVTILDLAKSK